MSSSFLPSMPFRKARTAPTFDPSDPYSLRQFFKDLLWLFEACGVSSDTERKHHVVYYVSLDISDLWICLPEFEDPQASFEAFREAIQSLYPETSPDRRYTFVSLQKLVSEVSEDQILTLEALSHFHRRFLFLSTFLLQKNRLSPREQVSMFLQAIPSAQQSQIRARLELLFLDHHPDDLHPFHRVSEAAKWVYSHPAPQTPPVSSSQAPAASPEVSSTDSKLLGQEVVSRLIDVVFNSLGQSLAPAVASTLPKSIPSPFLTPSRVLEPQKCFYCGGQGHRVRLCSRVIEDLASGRCISAQQGRIVLPSGDEIPRGLAGETIRQRLDRWWRAEFSSLKASQPLQQVAAVSRSLPSPRQLPDSQEVVPALPVALEVRRTQGQSSSEFLDLPESFQRTQSSLPLHPSSQSSQKLFQSPQSLLSSAQVLTSCPAPQSFVSSIQNAPRSLAAPHVVPRLPGPLCTFYHSFPGRPFDSQPQNSPGEPQSRLSSAWSQEDCPASTLRPRVRSRARKASEMSQIPSTESQAAWDTFQRPRVISRSSYSPLKPSVSSPIPQLISASPIAPIVSETTRERLRPCPTRHQTLPQLSSSFPVRNFKKSPQESCTASPQVTPALLSSIWPRKSSRDFEFRAAVSSRPQLIDSKLSPFRSSSLSPEIAASSQTVPQSPSDCPSSCQPRVQPQRHSKSTRDISYSSLAHPQPQTRTPSRFPLPTPPPSPQNVLDASEEFFDIK